MRGEVNEVTGAFTGQPNRHYHSNFLPLKDTSGKIIGGMIAFRDITLQKQYEQEIESNERLLRLLIDHLPETVFVKDMDSRFLMVNSAIVKSFKANSRDDIIGKTDFDFHSHELAEQYRADEMAIMASGQARLDYEEETFDVTRNETRWLNTSKIPLLDAQGKVMGLIGVNLDITERKRREKMLQNIIETAPDAMVIVNDQGTIVVANAQAQKVFGYSAEELIGASVDRLVPERLAGKHPQHRIGYFANRKTRPMGAGMELFGRRKDGSEFSVEISLSPLETEDGVLVSSVIRDITERKAVEQALRNYADELRDLYDNAPCGYHSLDRNGIFTQINETELRWLGYNRNELIGKKKITDLMTPASVEHFRRNFPVFQEQGWINDLEFELIRKDGSTFFILLNATATKDAAGNFLHSRSTLFDITDRKRKDKQIAYQASLLENVNDAIFALDTQFRITFWNKAAEQIYGWTAEEAIGQTSAIFHTVMTEQQRANVLQELAEKGHYRIDVAQQRRDGTPIYIEGTSITLRDDAGNLTGYVSVNRDVTERMRRDEQISYQAHLLANVSDAIFATDLQYYITFWNKAAEQMFGLSAAEALGQPTTILGQPVSEEQRALVRRELPLHGRYQMEILYRLPDGKSIYVDNTLITLYDDAKKPTGYISVNRDITERKRKEAEIQQLYSDLQHRSTLLEAANQELEAFSYSVSHDLRAPLRAIDGFSLALIEDFGDQLNDEGKNYAQRVRTASQRMAQLIDDLLKLSRLTRAEMHLEPVDMSALAQSVIEELQDRNPERQVTIQIAPNIITHGDKALLHVVLDNLLGNAWKFTGKTSAAQIEFGICEQKDDMMTCFVRDNGAGFDMAFTNKLFGAFQRLHAMNEFEGTGVGLATVKRVIHRHGGQVWAEGALAQGATFYFTLPVVVATVL
ncbi:MAG: PAS domain S-box protein [Anaerolineae bacterium]